MEEENDPQFTGNKDDTSGSQPEQHASNITETDQDEESNSRQNSGTIQQNQENFNHLCKLLVELGPQAMRQVFNSIHPPINLSTTLSKPTVHSQMKRLRNHGLVSQTQWEILYPQRKGLVNSCHYDPTLLLLLLKHLSPLSAPYPEGWYGMPLQGDVSISADLVRIQWFRGFLMDKLRGGDTDLEQKVEKGLWEQIKEILVRLGGVNIKLKVERLEREKSSRRRDKEDYIKRLQDWDHAARDVGAIEAVIDKRTQEGGDTNELGYSERGGGRFDRQLSEGVDRQQNTEKHKDVKKPPIQKKASVFKDVNSLSKDELRAHERTVLLKFYRQLTEVVQSDDVMPKLIQRSLMSHEEKNRISLATRNSDRMKMILELISKKNGNSFDKFCDAIKYKYKKLSDQLVKAKESPLKVEKPDEKSQCQAALQSVYKYKLRTESPIPWHPDISVALQEFVQPWYITDFKGRLVSAENLFSPHAKCERPSKIILQGFDGVGKSTLLRYLAAQWLQRVKDHSLHRYKMVFLVDLKLVVGDLEEEITNQLLGPGGYVRSPNELRKLLTANQKDILFLLDGYEDIENMDSGVWDLVHGKLYPQSSLILSVNTRFVTSTLLKHFDTHLVLMGLEADSQKQLINSYAKVTQTSIEQFSGLLDKVMNEFDTTLRTLSMNPLYGLCLCLIAEMDGEIDFLGTSSMMSTLLWAIEKQYHLKLEKERKAEIKEDIIKDAVHILDKLALEKLTDNKVLLSYSELVAAASDKPELVEIMSRLGLLVLVRGEEDEEEEDRIFAYVNRFCQEYMAARYLTQLDDNDFTAYLDCLTDEKHLHRVATFFCGIQRSNENQHTIQELFTALRQVQKQKCVMSRPSTKSSIHRDEPLSLTECRLHAMASCLDCIAEGQPTPDVIQIIADSFPSRLYMKQGIHTSPITVVGLAKIIRCNAVDITELELRLDHISSYYDHFFMVLADSVEKNDKLTTLKLRWTDENLMALFLANVFGENQMLRQLILIDESHSSQDDISATVWSNLWSASSHMRQIETLSFTQCSNPAIVTSFVRNSPQNLQKLLLNSCVIDLIGAQELATKIEKSTKLEVLNISSVQLKQSDFFYISNGIKLNKSLRELIMNEIVLSEDGFLALAEGLKFNTSIQRLDLRKVNLSVEACRALGHSLRVNQCMQEVHLTGASVTDEGVRLLKKQKRDSVKLYGLESKGIYGTKFLYDPHISAPIED